MSLRDETGKPPGDVESGHAAGLDGMPGFSGAPGSSPAIIKATQECGGPGGESKGWHSRGYLPHFDSPHAIQHVVFHPADSLPAELLARSEEELRVIPAELRNDERRTRIEAWLDAGHGCCLLRQPEAARQVQDALLYFNGLRYRLFEWSVMPNHVHSLLRPMEGWSLGRIVASWKSYTGRRLSALLPNSAGTAEERRVWQREYWDRFIRDENHFTAVRAYVRDNPVKAGLVRHSGDWPWGSAAVSI